MQPVSGNQRRDLLTSLMNMSLALRLPWKMHLCRFPRLPSFSEMLQNPHGLLPFDKVRNPFRLPRKRGFNVQSDIISSLLFSDSSHLCFSSVHIVRSLTSKLPSISETWDHKIIIKTMKPPSSYKVRCVWSTVWFLDFLNLVDHMPRRFLFNPQNPFDLPAPDVNSWGICFLGKGKKKHVCIKIHLKHAKQLQDTLRQQT